MKFGLFSINMHACSTPEAIGRVGRLAEEAGFESVWGGEHVVLPDPQVPPSPLAPEDRVIDPVIALTYVAALTRTIRLGTGIIILPQRNPLVLAKELAGLDVLSGGRLIFGIGVGYLEPEFRALNIPFDDRGQRTDEYLAAMRAIWSEPNPAYQGDLFSFSGVQANPRPIQQPTPPIVVGGRTPPAYRRAVTKGHGWYGYFLDPESTAQNLAGLKEAADRYDRPAELGDLEISVTPRGRIDEALVEQYAALGVHRLVLLPHPRLDAAGVEEFVTGIGGSLIPRYGGK